VERQNLGLRILACYASVTADEQLFEWLLGQGLKIDEVLIVSKWERNLPFTITSANSSIVDLFEGCERRVLPSLLAIAVQENNIPWTRFLISQGADPRDSMALLRAVAQRADTATISLLLQAAELRKKERCGTKRAYGSAALREAILQRNLTLIDLLCRYVDLDAMESATKDSASAEPSISPMGEAILQNDNEMMEILLRKGADPNACVAVDDWEALSSAGGLMTRVTPLIAAIDKQSLSMVKILVQTGAELQYINTFGVERTPLQRAAEIGNLDIVRYLIDQDATVDTTPVWSGGTALQLAAMNGYVGIATFLLERGANPNYPPAEGHGRTAFEAAAERGRIDMMSLLVQWGVQFDMEFGKRPKSQYERALRFSQRKGYMAANRFVKQLYKHVQDRWTTEPVQDLSVPPMAADESAWAFPVETNFTDFT
jgi:ankyrin repeat protein